VLRGDVLEIPDPQAIERDSSQPLSRKQQLEELEKLKRETGLSSS
jgi:hypothetical protein